MKTRNERQKEYYHRNKENILKKSKEKYQLDSSKKREYANKYRLNNLNKIKE